MACKNDMAIHTSGLSLCAGIGGLEFGIKLALGNSYRTVCYVEREAYAVACLVARMEEGLLDTAPVWDDVESFDGRPWRGVVDIVTAGYPCQPFSCAGKQRGAEDERHLWPQIIRIVENVRPALCFFENVSNHLNIGSQAVCEDLWRLGYGVEAGIFSAEEVGAPHIRRRLFILAYSEGLQLQGLAPTGTNDAGSRSEELADAKCERPQGPQHEAPRQGETALQGRSPDASWPPGPEGDWSGVPEGSQPSICRVADGASARPHRLRSLGNAVVPQTAAKAFRELMDRAWKQTRQNTHRR